MFREPSSSLERMRRPPARRGRPIPAARVDWLDSSRQQTGSDGLENWPPGSAHLGYLPFPRARGQVHLALSSDPAAIRDLNKTLRAPPVFASALEGSLTDASHGIAIVQECFRTVTESPAFGAAYV